MKPPPIRETDLYDPIKQFLVGQGYVVKGEIGKVDLVACRGEEPPLLVELKTSFSLSLFHQAVERQSLSDSVYIAVPHQTGKVFSRNLKRNISLCRRLGIGLLTVRLKDGSVYAHLDPGPYRPRQSRKRTAQLLKEFSRRVGDPTRGGATRTGLITAYRQDALRCLNYLDENGPTKAAQVAAATEVEVARRIMSDDHYGWFERVDRGIYGLTPNGREALQHYESELQRLIA